jgi:outer membrane biosynthesis protein TonB
MTLHYCIYRLALLIFILILSSALLYSQDRTIDSDAKVINAPRFQLPQSAQDAGVDGKIRLTFTVDKNGEAKGFTVLSGPAWPCGTKPSKAIDDALDAVKENIRATRFSPAIKNGKPVSSDVTMTFLIGDAYDAWVKKRDAKMQGTGKIVKHGIVNGRALSLPIPDIPAGAGRIMIRITVYVDVLIDEEGNVIRAGATSGGFALQEASRNAACRAKFSPTLVDGAPIKVAGMVTYNFVP